MSSEECPICADLSYEGKVKMLKKTYHDVSEYVRNLLKFEDDDELNYITSLVFLRVSRAKKLDSSLNFADFSRVTAWALPDYLKFTPAGYCVLAIIAGKLEHPCVSLLTFEELKTCILSLSERDVESLRKFRDFNLVFETIVYELGLEISRLFKDKVISVTKANKEVPIVHHYSALFNDLRSIAAKNTQLSAYNRVRAVIEAIRQNIPWSCYWEPWMRESLNRFKNHNHPWKQSNEDSKRSDVEDSEATSESN